MTADPLALFAELQDAPSPLEAMRRLCIETRESAGEREPAISLSPIWRRLGASVSYDETVGDGSTEAVGDGFVVRIPASRRRAARGASWRRTRFTLAHELGHVMLMRNLPAGTRAEMASARHHKTVEELCNAAAAELLIPATWLAADLAENGLTPSALVTAYDRYLVSWQALAFQIAEVTGGTASLWRTGVRDGEPHVFRVSKSSRGARWLPDELSERYLSEPVISLAVRDGVATCAHLRSSHAVTDAGSPAIAVSLTAAMRSGTPTWKGMAIPDEGIAGQQVLLLRLPPDQQATFEFLYSPPAALSA